MVVGAVDEEGEGLCEKQMEVTEAKLAGKTRGRGGARGMRCRRCSDMRGRRKARIEDRDGGVCGLRHRGVEQER